MTFNLKGIFLENLGIKQTIFKNVFWLASAELFSRFLEAVLIIYIVRVLGAAEFGKFAFAMAVASLFISFSSFGLSEIITREMAYDPEAQKEYSAVLSLKIILGIAVFFLAIAASLLITGDAAIRLMIMVLTVFYFINDFFSIIYAFLRARQKMEYEAGFKIARSLVLTVVVSFIVFKAPFVQQVSYGYLGANFLALISVLVFFHYKVYPLQLSFDFSIWRKFFTLSWPLGLAAVSGAIFINTDSVVMGHLGQIVENGWYGAARKTVGIIIIPATLVFMSFYPMASKLFKESREKLQRVWDHYMASMIFFAFPVTAAGVIIAPKLMPLVYGAYFTHAIVLFQILIFIAGINFLYYPYALILIASGHQRKYLWAHLAGALVNVTCNVVLIPRYSAYGAAVSAVITFGVLLAVAVALSKQFTPIAVFSRPLLVFSLIVIISSLVMSIAILQPAIYRGNILYPVVFGTLTYLAVFLSSYTLFKKLGFFPDFSRMTIGKITIL